MMPQIIANRYQLETKIGSGGMGTVYCATDVQTQQTVAVKVLKPEIAADPAVLERFRREGEALRQLNHPNIVKMLDMVQPHYLVMEYVGGGTLRDEMGEVMSIDRVLNVALDIADALTRAHRLDIIHRDIKPGNVLLATDGTPRLTDFGIARIGDASQITEAGSLLGTLAYLSPEACRDEAIDARHDIWAFGAMLYEMLTGKLPFSGGNVIALMSAIVGQPLPDLEAMRPDVPVALVDLIYRMLDKDPQARVPSVRIVGADVEAILQGREAATGSIEVEPRTVIVTGTARFATPTASGHGLSNLPAQLTPFVGRERELAALEQLLSDPARRLITIQGPGGMGKTRLSIEAASRHVGRFAQGVFFVPLAPLTSPDGIVAAIAEAVGYQIQEEARSPQQQVFDYLAEKMALLVLDNFEHVLAGAGLVSELLAAAPQVKVIATSRARLNQSAESVFDLGGFEVPETDEDAMQISAVQLFVQSARRAQPDFDLETTMLTAVVQICRLVDGMPLGIVLAASWVRLLAPDEIVTEIAASRDFLETDMGDIPQRQRSIRAVFEYSWNLLDATERKTLAALTVFRGGFTREASAAVTGASLRTLMALVNQSLLRRDPATGRFEIHELLRQYAAEQRDDDAVHTAHSRYYLQLLAAQRRAIHGQEQMRALALIDADFENIRAAWTRAVEQRDLEALLNGPPTLERFCMYRKRSPDGEAMLHEARSGLRPVGDDEPHLAWAQVLSSFAESEEDAQQAREVAQTVGAPPEEAHALAALSMLAVERGDIQEAIKLMEQALSVLAPDEPDVARGRQHLGMLYAIVGDIPTAVKYERMAEEMYRERGDRYGLVLALNDLGTILAGAGSLAEGIPALEECVSVCRAINDWYMLAWVGANLTLFLVHTEQLAAAHARLDEIEAYADNLNDPMLWAKALHAKVLVSLTEADFAGGLHHNAELHRQLARTSNPAVQASYGTFAALLHLGQGHDADAIQQGRESLQATSRFGNRYFATWALVGLAGALAHRRRDTEAVSWLACGYAQLPYVEATLRRHAFLNDLRSALQTELSAYDEAWERGQALEFEAVVKAVLSKE